VAVARKGDVDGVLTLESAEAHIKKLPSPRSAGNVETEEPLSRAGAFASAGTESSCGEIDGAHSCMQGAKDCLAYSPGSGVCVVLMRSPVPTKELVSSRCADQRFQIPSEHLGHLLDRRPGGSHSSGRRAS